MNRDRARQLRSNATDHERWLWLHIRNWRKEGFPVRRQVPIGPYIADFACHTCKVVIELDGGQHNTPEARSADAERDAWLESRGYKVLRFWNCDIRNDLPDVLDAIRRVMEERHPESRRSPAP